MENTLDIKLKLLRGKPINNIKPLTLGDIEDIGYKKYLYFLTILLSKVEDWNIPNYSNKNISSWEILKTLLLNGEKDTINAFKVFISDNILLLENEVFINDNIMTSNIYDDIVFILKLQNFCVDVEKVGTPKTEGAKRLYKIFEEREKILKKIKKDKELDLGDYIVFYCENNTSGINIKNVWDLTVYEFYTQFKAQNLIENFYMGFKQVLAGVNPKKINFEHYLKKL